MRFAIQLAVRAAAATCWAFCTAGKIITFIAILASDFNYRIVIEIVDVLLGKIDYSEPLFAFILLKLLDANLLLPKLL